MIFQNFFNLSVISKDNNAMYKKSFFIPRYIVSTWKEAGPICSSYGLELASLYTLEEYNNVVPMLTRLLKSTKLTDWIFINGMTLVAKSRNDWYWVNSGQKISYVMPWWNDLQPDFYLDRQWCLALGPSNEGLFKFDDNNCSEIPQKFLCQKLEILVS
jgi:hypothetical protein